MDIMGIVGCFIIAGSIIANSLCIDKKTPFWMVVLSHVFLALGITITYDALNRDNPKALDVYRDRTALEITYRDSIPVDSTVVWKPEFKPK